MKNEIQRRLIGLNMNWGGASALKIQHELENAIDKKPRPVYISIEMSRSHKYFIKYCRVKSNLHHN